MIDDKVTIKRCMKNFRTSQMIGFLKGTFEGSEQGLTLLPSDRLVIQKVKSRGHSPFLLWFQPLFCSFAGGRAQLLVHLMSGSSGDDHFSSHITFYSCSNLFDDHGNIFFSNLDWEAIKCVSTQIHVHFCRGNGMENL